MTPDTSDGGDVPLSCEELYDRTREGQGSGSGRRRAPRRQARMLQAFPSPGNAPQGGTEQVHHRTDAPLEYPAVESEVTI